MRKKDYPIYPNYEKNYDWFKQETYEVSWKTKRGAYKTAKVTVKVGADWYDMSEVDEMVVNEVIKLAGKNLAGDISWDYLYGNPDMDDFLELFDKEEDWMWSERECIAFIRGEKHR